MKFKGNVRDGLGRPEFLRLAQKPLFCNTTKMSVRPRIAVLRFAQESHPLSPELTRFEDFTRQHYFEGDALAPRVTGELPEAPGFLKRAELTGFVREFKRITPDAEIIPILSAWMVPAGPLSKECFAEVIGRAKKRLAAAGQIDGLMLSTHGAMSAVGMIDPEAVIIEQLRGVVGNVPIVCTLDLHANMSVEKIATGAYFFAYHTNPHRDHAQSGARAARFLNRLLTGYRPHVAWRSLPMLTGGATTLDFLPPMLPIFMKAKNAIRKGAVDDVSVLMSNPWVAHPDLGWASYVIGEESAAESLADELAERLWAVRKDQPPHFPSAAEAVDKVRAATFARKLGCIMLHDASDVVTAGSTGDNPRLLDAALTLGPDLVFYGLLRDPETVDHLFKVAPGTVSSVQLGGGIDPKRSPRKQYDVTLLSKHDDLTYGRRVVVQHGRSFVVLTEGAAFSARPDFYTSVGLEPRKADAVIVKNFFPPLITYVGHFSKAFFVKTKGITDFDAAAELTFNNPVYPIVDVADYKETDRVRRARPAQAQGVASELLNSTQIQ